MNNHCEVGVANSRIWSLLASINVKLTCEKPIEEPEQCLCHQRLIALKQVIMIHDVSSDLAIHGAHS